MRLIDLTLSISSQDAWTKYPARVTFGQEEPPTRIETFATIAKDGLFMQKIQTTTQSFTHIDAPKHFYEDGLANDEIPLEQLVGEAVLIDLSHKHPGEGVTAADLSSSTAQVKEGDIVILRSGWTERGPWGTERFWRAMIWLSTDACDWLIGRGIKSLALDFMAEVQPFVACPHCGALRPSGKGSPNHRKFLKKGIVLIEWLTNLGAISRERVWLICLPLKIKGSDGAPARVIAIEGGLS
ncbi:MAG: cyclase family protein [Chloroflexi bacterium]|nr:cyclase family protein [Chloroflexota bacterium]MCL5074310.1 cyclase family protein [Chloroflexota bacterium]